MSDDTERDPAEEAVADEAPRTGKHTDQGGHVMVTQSGPMPAGPEMDDAWAPSGPTGGD